MKTLPANPIRDPKALIGAILLFSLAFAGAAVAAGDLPAKKALPLAFARAAAAAALAACEQSGYRVSVAVVDKAGLLKVMLKADGAGPHTLDSSGKKAYTSLSLRHSTGELVELVRKTPAAAGLEDMNDRILILGGGLPIEAAGEVIGGIGVGGAPGGDKDEACALAGIEAIRDRLR